MIDTQPEETNTTIPVATTVIPPSGKSKKTLCIILGLIIFFIIIILPICLGTTLIGVLSLTMPQKDVAVSIKQPNSSTIIVTYDGGKDADLLYGIVISVTDNRAHQQIITLSPPDNNGPLEAGEHAIFTGAFTGKEHVTAVGLFSDGTHQNLVNTYV